jgi:hypothetical protein
MNYLIAAYAVFWAISFGLVFSMFLRQGKVRADLEALRVMLDQDPLAKD